MMDSVGFSFVSTNHVGIPEVVLDCKTGVLSQEREVDELTEESTICWKTSIIGLLRCE